MELEEIQESKGMVLSKGKTAIASLEHESRGKTEQQK